MGVVSCLFVGSVPLSSCRVLIGMGLFCLVICTGCSRVGGFGAGVVWVRVVAFL